MKTENSKPKTLIITAWVFLLLASDLPRIVLQEIFDYPVSIVLGNSGLTFPNDLGFGISAVFVILVLSLGTRDDFRYLWHETSTLPQQIARCTVFSFADCRIFSFSA